MVPDILHGNVATCSRCGGIFIRPTH